MRTITLTEALKAAGVTNAEYTNDYSELGVSLTDSAVLKLASYTGELPTGLKKHLEYKLPFVQKRAEELKQRQAEKQRRADEEKRRQSERQAQASADLDKRLVARLRSANPSITEAEAKEMLPELRRRHFFAEMERQDEASGHATHSVLTEF